MKPDLDALALGGNMARCSAALNTNVEVTVYSMEEFAKECVMVFCSVRTRVYTTPTPFLDESKDPLTVIQEDISLPGQA